MIAVVTPEIKDAAPVDQKKQTSEPVKEEVKPEPAKEDAPQATRTRKEGAKVESPHNLNKFIRL